LDQYSAAAYEARAKDGNESAGVEASPHQHAEGSDVEAIQVERGRSVACGHWNFPFAADGNEAGCRACRLQRLQPPVAVATEPEDQTSTDERGFRGVEVDVFYRCPIQREIADQTPRASDAAFDERKLEFGFRAGCSAHRATRERWRAGERLARGRFNPRPARWSSA
jgi:hypothetical protein